MEGFQDSSVRSILETFSFNQYTQFSPLKRPGLQSMEDLYAVAAHDAKISELLLQFLFKPEDGHVRKVVGIMGGHSVARSSTEYADTATLSRQLAKAGYLVVTGGGPGIMEAAHIGAYYAKVDDSSWKTVLEYLGSAKTVAKGAYDRIPEDDLLGTDGKPSAQIESLLPLYHGWHAFACDLKKSYSATPSESLAISTWEFGQEPVSPFATAYACYFQNSIRESTLVREARAGIVFARGGGGTLREIWQGVEENYYAKSRDDVTPMIFFDREAIWGDFGSRGTRPLDVYSTIMSVLANKAPKLKNFCWEDKIVATTCQFPALRRHPFPA